MNEIKTWEDFWEREKDSLYLQNLKVFLNAQDPNNISSAIKFLTLLN